MPNWCANALVIEATTQENAQELRRLTSHMEDDGTLFSFFMPLKEGEYGGDVWGTKWEADVIHPFFESLVTEWRSTVDKACITLIEEYV